MAGKQRRYPPEFRRPRREIKRLRMERDILE